MSQIVLSQEQANVFVHATGPVTFCDSNGNVLGKVNREDWFSAEEIAEAKRRADQEGPGITTQELLARLRKLAPE
jgi:hypothetical protein